MRQSFDISINDYDRELFTEWRTVLEQREEESPAHVLLKALAVALHFNPEMVIEAPDVDIKYRPDVVVRADDGKPEVWIECGQVRTVKLDKLCSQYRDCRFIVVKKTEREARELMERCAKDCRYFYNLEYLGFDRNFVDEAASWVMGRNDCIAIISAGTFTFIINGHEFTTALHRLNHGPIPYRGK